MYVHSEEKETLLIFCCNCNYYFFLLSRYSNISQDFYKFSACCTQTVLGGPLFKNI